MEPDDRVALFPLFTVLVFVCTLGAIINDFIYSAGGDSFVTRNGRLSAIIQNYNTDFYRANKTRDTAKKYHVSAVALICTYL